MQKNKLYKTDFLFPKTSFWKGMGSVFNIAGNYFNFNYSSDKQNPDIRALSSDWKMIGEDFKTVKNKLEKM